MMNLSLQMPVASIFLTAILSENVALYYFLGICPLISISGNLRTSWQMGLTVSFVMMITMALNWGLFYLLLKPLEIEYLQLLFFILSIAAVVQFLESFLDRFFPSAYEMFGIFLPLITVNCAILGVSMFAILREYNLLEAMSFAAGSGVGWTAVLCVMASLRRRVDLLLIPKELGTIGLTMIIAAIIAMGFSGLSGLSLPGAS